MQERDGSFTVNAAVSHQAGVERESHTIHRDPSKPNLPSTGGRLCHAQAALLACTSPAGPHGIYPRHNPCYAVHEEAVRFCTLILQAVERCLVRNRPGG